MRVKTPKGVGTLTGKREGRLYEVELNEQPKYYATNKLWFTKKEMEAINE